MRSVLADSWDARQKSEYFRKNLEVDAVEKKLAQCKQKRSVMA
jgi:hypothetical protein